MAAGQQFVHHAAERIDIVGERRLVAAQHFHAGVGRGQRAQRGRVEHRVVIAGFGAGQFRRAGDAEVEHLGEVSCTDHDVARLEVRMHDAGGMRALQGAPHALDQRPGLGQRHALAQPAADQPTQVVALDVPIVMNTMAPSLSKS